MTDENTEVAPAAEAAPETASAPETTEETVQQRHYRWVDRQRQLAKSEVVNPDTGNNIMGDFDQLTAADQEFAILQHQG